MQRRRYSRSLCFLPALLGAALQLFPQEVRYSTGSWDPDSFGNHRAVLEVEKKSDAVWAHIPWRRRDPEPEKKNIIITEEKTGKRVTNLFRADINRAFGDIVFQAQNGGTYYVYYLPYSSQGRNYPKVTYPAPEHAADGEWLARHGLNAEARSQTKKQTFPRAKLVEIQAIDEFNSFYPMEVAATPEEVEGLLRAHSGKPYLLFPEDRSFPIRMSDDLPYRWVKDDIKPEFTGQAERNEFYTFQIGLFASSQDIKGINLKFSNLINPEKKHAISASALRCFNTGGVNWDGTLLDKTVSVKKGKVQALWFGVQIPKEAPAGHYRGQVDVTPRGMPTQTVRLNLNVVDRIIPDSGDDEPWRHSRLRWLDSRLAFDDEVVRPFSPVTVNGSAVGILGRRLTIGATGLPEQIESFFSPEVTGILDRGTRLLSSPVELIVERAAGTPLSWETSSPKITKQNAGVVEWKAKSASGPLTMAVQASIESDGFVDFQVTLSASAPLEVNDIRLQIPLAREVAKYMMGLGLKGGLRPSSYEWTWDVNKNQDGAWIGDANAGLQFSLRAENYSRPLNTNFYQSKPLNMPPSWFNHGRGGISIREADDNTLLVRSYSGKRTLQPGQELHFDFNLLLTPFRPLDTNFQWSTRFFHSFKPVDEVIHSGANTINVHHANDANPYINYPFIHQKQMRTYIDEAHRKGLKVKIYYTIRELSTRAPELFALRSLGNEIFSDGPGGGFSWLQEHLGSNYIAAWFVPQLKDAAIINSGMSRWHNYYVEGLDWLVRNMQIDGLYIDDVAFDRTTMKRVRKILDRGRTGAIIDLHSANQFNPRDGFANSANLYLEHFPYINRLWFGEYFDPNSPPDFWLIEMSGIPYGLMGEMLQDGGNRWRGMIYGMTNRMPYDGNDPSPIWKVWDELGIQDSRMIGYWSPRCPVKTGNKDVLATAYARAGKTLVALASWARNDVDIRLSIDWKSLGLDPAKAILTAPDVPDLQPSAQFKPEDPIPIQKGKGWLLILEPAREVR